MRTQPNTSSGINFDSRVHDLMAMVARLQDAKKSIKATNANLLAGSLEDLPFGLTLPARLHWLAPLSYKICAGILGLLYVLKIAGSNLLQLLSVASSFLMLGTSLLLSDATVLSYFW